MAHITLPDGARPGIGGLLQFRPLTARPLCDLADTLLRADNSLTRGERELIAAYVSRLNDCAFCHKSHAAFSALQIDGGWATVDAVIADPDSEAVSPKLRALLAIAAQVAESGRAVTDATVASARGEGATDVEIHDAVLIAAAFCMFNRYVDGLGTFAPPERAAYEFGAALIVEHGYLAALTSR